MILSYGDSIINKEVEILEYLHTLIYLLPMLFVAGVVDGIAGGGGVIALPAYMLSGMPIHSCYACNKLQSGLGTAAACGKYIREGFVDLKTAVVALPFTIAASFLSTKVILYLNSDVIKIIILVCMPIAVGAMFLKLKMTSTDLLKADFTVKTVMLSALAGIILGTYDALFGPGGGTIAMIIYALFLNYDLRVGCGNGKVIIVVSNITAVISFIQSGYMIYHVAIPCSVINMIGCYLGAALATKKGSKIILPAMIFVIVAVVVQTILNFVI